MKHLGARLATGDRAAFAELYDVCADRLHHYLVLRLGSRHDAEDVIQEVFLRLVRHRRKLRSVANLTAYVFTIARNEANRFAERTKRGPGERRDVQASLVFDEACSDDLAQRETAEVVVRALGGLSPSEREVIELKTYGGFTFREIAEMTGLPQGTVATRYRTGLNRLRRTLTQ